jgi:hypothetical protein
MGKTPLFEAPRPEKMLMDGNGTRGCKRQSAGIYREMKQVESVCGRVTSLERGDGEQPDAFIERTAFGGSDNRILGVYHMYDDRQASIAWRIYRDEIYNSVIYNLNSPVTIWDALTCTRRTRARNGSERRGRGKTDCFHNEAPPLKRVSVPCWAGPIV